MSRNSKETLNYTSSINKLHFTKKWLLHFQTETKYDYLEIRDGGDATSTKLGKFSGTTLPKNIKSTGNQLFVKFHSDFDRRKKGFSASLTKGKK